MRGTEVRCIFGAAGPVHVLGPDRRPGGRPIGRVPGAGWPRSARCCRMAAVRGGGREPSDPARHHLLLRFRPERRGPNGIYPEIYLFHVGGRHGDHSPYDFWPARKEVFVDADPREVLDQINDKGITRLAVPDGSAVPADASAQGARDGSGPHHQRVCLLADRSDPRWGSRHRRAGDADGDQRTEYVPAGPAACAPGWSLPANFKENDPEYNIRLRARMNEAPTDERASA